MRYLRGHREQGGGNDHNRWARCSHCGFILDVTKTARGEGVGYTNTPVQTSGSAGADIIVITPDTDFEVVPAYDGTGLGINKYYRPHNQVVANGCPFCGSLNW